MQATRFRLFHVRQLYPCHHSSRLNPLMAIHVHHTGGHDQWLSHSAHTSFLQDQIVSEDHNKILHRHSTDVLPGNEFFHSVLLYPKSPLYIGWLQMATTDNHPNSACAHLFRREDATSVGHRLRETVGRHNEVFARVPVQVENALTTIHLATDRGNQMHHLIDSNRFFPTSCMPAFDSSATHL